MVDGQAGKGDKTRPRLVAEEEYSIRWDLMVGAIDREEFEQRMYELQQQGKIRR